MRSKISKLAPGRTQLEFDFSQPVAPFERSVAKSEPTVPVATRAETLQHAADRLRAEICRATGLDVRLRITNNTSTMMSLRYDAAGKVANVGLHHMFLEAPEDVRRALGQWVLRPSGKVAGKTLEAFIARQRHLIRPRTARQAAARTVGEYFDLRELYAEVNGAEFNNEVNAPITWGKMPSLRKRRSIRFGSYSPDENLIRIHPLLDQDFVPRFFIRYIVFHEMLHAHMGIEESATGRRKIHPPEFRRREAEYGDFERAVQWMDNEKNLRRLLRMPRR